MSKPTLYMDVFDWLENQKHIVAQMLYEFGEIDFYVVEGWFIGYRKIHVTGGINGNTIHGSGNTKSTSKTKSVS